MNMKYVIKKNKGGLNRNCIMDNGNYLSKDWFSYIGHFNYGWAKVSKYEKSNYINKAGIYISKEWFDECHDFILYRVDFDAEPERIFGMIKIKDQYYYVDTIGNIIHVTPNKYTGMRIIYPDPFYEKID